MTDTMTPDQIRLRPARRTKRIPADDLRIGMRVVTSTGKAHKVISIEWWTNKVREQMKYKLDNGASYGVGGWETVEILAN